MVHPKRPTPKYLTDVLTCCTHSNPYERVYSVHPLDAGRFVVNRPHGRNTHGNRTWQIQTDDSRFIVIERKNENWIVLQQLTVSREVFEALSGR